MLSFLLKPIVSLVRRWAEAHEARVLCAGVPLTAEQRTDAARIGVREPGRVRLMAVESIPTPLDWLPAPARRLARAIAGDTIGITLGHAIYLRRDWLNDRALLVHELVHVTQYERLGMRGFLQAYVEECVRPGYPHGPLEREAIACTAVISGRCG
jgi:hypothetical protein